MVLMKRAVIQGQTAVESTETGPNVKGTTPKDDTIQC